MNVGRPRGGRPRAGGIHIDRASFSCAGSPNVKGKWGWLKPQASRRGHHSSRAMSSGPAYGPQALLKQPSYLESLLVSAHSVPGGTSPLSRKFSLWV